MKTLSQGGFAGIGELTEEKALWLLFYPSYQLHFGGGKVLLVLGRQMGKGKDR